MLALRRSVVRLSRASAPSIALSSRHYSEQIVRHRQAAIDALATIQTPVLTIDCLHLPQSSANRSSGSVDGTWHRRYDAYLRERSQRVATLVSRRFTTTDDSWTGHDVLLGDESQQFDVILISEHSSGAAASKTITRAEMNVGLRSVGTGSLTLAGVRSAAFEGLPTFDDIASITAEPPAGRDWSDCPFAHEDTAHVGSWRALIAEPSQHMFAFNLIRTPDPGAYREYAGHFASLPSRHGMRFVEVATLDTMASVLVCDDDLTEAQIERIAAFDLMALVYFPSSARFVDAWSEPEIVREAYPLRQRMLARGFRHVWLRMEAAEAARERGMGGHRERHW